MTTSVSVVIPTRDRRDLLLVALRSVLRQRDVDVEVIVVDDGSADGSPEAVEAVRDPRIRVLRHERPRGVSMARNAGARAASGAWVAFLDDDDVWSPDKLALQLRAAAERGAVWAYGGAVEIDVRGRVLSGDPPPSPETLVAVLPFRNAMPAGCSNVVIDAAEFDRLGGFDAGLRHLPDWDLWLRLASTGMPAMVSAPVVGYRQHADQATLDTNGMVAEARVLEARHGADARSIYRWLAWSHLRRGERSGAVRAYAHAVAKGDVGSIGRIVVALVHPRPLSLGSRRDSDASVAWRRDASRWLAAFEAD